MKGFMHYQNLNSIKLVTFKPWHVFPLRRIRNDEEISSDSLSEIVHFNIEETFKWAKKKHKEQLFRVIVKGIKVMGYIQVVEAEGKGWIGICISKSWQGRGIGKEALSALLELEKIKKVDLRISVSTQNLRAVSLYSALGFYEIERTCKIYQGNEIELIIMSY